MHSTNSSLFNTLLTSGDHKTPSAQVLYIPYTFGPNFNKKGVTKEQVFWHMRNLNLGHIDHIDMTEKVDNKGINVRSWFIHFTTWTPTDEITKTFHSGGHIELTYDAYGHFWKIFQYVPKAPTAPFSEPGEIILKEGPIAPPTDFKLASIPKKYSDRFELAVEFKEFQNSIETDIPFVEGLTDTEYHIASQMYDELEDHYIQNTYGLKNESENPADTVYFVNMPQQQNMFVPPYYYGNMPAQMAPISYAAATTPSA